MIDKDKLVRALTKLGWDFKLDSKHPGFYFKDTKKTIPFNEVGTFFRKDDNSNKNNRL